MLWNGAWNAVFFSNQNIPTFNLIIPSLLIGFSQTQHLNFGLIRPDNVHICWVSNTLFWFHMAHHTFIKSSLAVCLGQGCTMNSFSLLRYRSLLVLQSHTLHIVCFSNSFTKTLTFGEPPLGYVIFSCAIYFTFSNNEFIGALHNIYYKYQPNTDIFFRSLNWYW